MLSAIEVNARARPSGRTATSTRRDAMSSTPEIAIIGVGLHPFGRYEDRSALEMGAVAISRALRDAGLDWSDVGSLYAGSLEVANPEAGTGLAGMTGLPARATLS